MGSGRRARAISFIISVLLVLQCVLPMAAYAAEHEVQLEFPGTTSGQAQRVRQIGIDGVDAPKAGVALDQAATVSTADGQMWDIPVIWVRDDLEVGNDLAEEGRTYLPVLAFFVPREYSLDGDVYLYAMDEDGQKAYFDLEHSGVMKGEDGNEPNNTPARYVSGYLATLYLSELALRHMDSNDTSIATTAGERPNGSILFELNTNFVTPLDSTKKSSSDSIKIVESNEMVESSVRSDEAQISGGKSDPDQAAGGQLAATAVGAHGDAAQPQAGAQAGMQGETTDAQAGAQDEAAQAGTLEATAQTLSGETGDANAEAQSQTQGDSEAHVVEAPDAQDVQDVQEQEPSGLPAVA